MTAAAPGLRKTAVVTGAAGGIGAGLAREAARRGMNVVLADVDGEALERIRIDLVASGAHATTVRCDVASAGDVEAVAAEAERAFGGTDILISNAGVALERPVWEYTERDWQWVLGVNLWGAIHGIRAFVPRMLARGTGQVVNVASTAGLTPLTNLGAYSVAKHAVIALTETLHHDLRAMNSGVHCAVLCPGRVQTDIESSQRNRPARWTDAGGAVPQEPHRFSPASATSVMTPDSVARVTFDAVAERRFWIFTHSRVKASVQARTDDLVAERAPRDPYTL